VNSNEFEALESRIKEELENLMRLRKELTGRNLWETKKLISLPIDSNDSFMLRAIGSIIHDFYVAVENVFEMIAREIDGALPKDPEWHHSLLKQMAVSLPTHRPAVIQKSTMEVLNEFRAFRHIFRNLYGFSLSPLKLKLLLDSFPSAIENFSHDLTVFLKKMKDCIRD
jgi:HepT-like protein